MDSPTLVRDFLSIEVIERGESLIEELDKKGFVVKAALWFFESELNIWRLILGIEEVDVVGPKEVYKTVQKILLDVGLSDLGIQLTDIKVVSPHHQLIQGLRKFMKTGKEIVRTRVKRNHIGGQYIEDALIYRVR